MDRGLDHVPRVLCGHHGSVELRSASVLGAASALYGRILWLHWPDALLCHQGESPLGVGNEKEQLANVLQHSAFLTLISAVIQVVCLAWYLVSYFPMGASSLRMVTTFGARQATSWMSG